MNAEFGGSLSSILKNRYVKLLLIAGTVCIVDQFVKALIVSTVPVYQTISVIPGFFNLTHIYNPGGAFGFLSGSPSELRHFFFLISSVVAMGLIFFLYAKTPPGQGLLEFGLSLIMGGAIGNIIDRIRIGKVIDFLDLYVKDLHWPAFNVADSAITIGIGLFIYHLLFKDLNR
jgi:signal peptidase II